jgi:hypothetical protein
MGLANIYGKSSLALILLGSRFASTLGYSYILYRHGKGGGFSESIYALLFFDYLYGSVGYIFRNSILFERVTRAQVASWLILFSIIGAFAALLYSHSLTSVIVVCAGAVMYPFYVLVAAHIEKDYVTLASIVETIGALSGALIGAGLAIAYSCELIADFSLAYRPLSASVVVSVLGYFLTLYSKRGLLESSALRIPPLCLPVNKEKAGNSLALPGLIYLTVLMVFKNSFFGAIGGVFVGLNSDALHKEFLRFFASLYDPTAAFCGLLLRWKLLESKNNSMDYLRSKTQLLNVLICAAFGAGGVFMWHQSTLSLALFAALIFICLAAFQASLLFGHRNMEFILSAGLLFLTGASILFDAPAQALAIAGVFVIVFLRLITIESNR